LVLLLAGCWPLPSGNSSQVVLVLFDDSQSTRSPRTQNEYLSGFQKVLEYVSKGGRLGGDAIDADSLGDSFFPINQRFPKYNPATENPLLHKAKIKQQLAEVNAEARRLVSQRPTVQGTEILDGLTAAQRYFDTYSADKKRYLVIFSDMVEESARLHLTKSVLSNPQRVIQSDVRSHRLPDLHDVDVYIAGADASSSERFRDIQSFWLKYLPATGANVDGSRYGPSLIEFPQANE
jgi:hypothetical protein